jgi:hypothetical protein
VIDGDLEHWLTLLRHRRWVLHVGGDPRGPEWIAAHKQWDACTDVVIIRDERSATACRVPGDEFTDVLEPQWVTWVYSASPVWTLRAVLTLAEPGSPDEPVCLIPAPSPCRIPRVGRRPVTVRPLG